MNKAMFPFDQPLNELVFENKNKMYGAYVIRREYSYSLKIAILTAAGFMLLIVGVAAYLNEKNTTLPNVLKEVKEDLGIIINIQKDEDTQIEKKEIIQGKKHIQNTTPPPVGELKASDEILKPEEKKKIEPTAPVDQNAIAGTDTSDITDRNKGSNFGITENKKIEPEKPELVPGEMPDIEGGFLPYVSSHVRYPEGAIENRVQGTVHISFIVERDGSITNVSIMNKEKLGYGCEEEAIRVIKSAKWKPGRNNHQPVRVQLSMPVKYRLQ